jgi:hypothetical protein
MTKEEEFFDKAEKTVLSKEEEQEMFEQFQSVMAITKKIEVFTKCIWTWTWLRSSSSSNAGR